MASPLSWTRNARGAHDTRRPFALPAVDLYVAAFLAVVALLLFAPAFNGYVLEWRDFPRWSVPGRALWRNAVLEGELPFWNPLAGIGSPSLAAPVYGTLYPGHLLLLLAGPIVLAVQLTWIAHLFWTGLGGYFLAKALGCRPASALASALAWMLSGYTISMWGNGEKILSGAWIPWTVLGCVSLVQRDRWWRWPLLSTALALSMIATAGDPFLWFHAVLLGSATMMVVEGPPLRFLLRALARVSAAVVLGALLSGVALVPALLLLGETDRSGGLPLHVAELWSLEPKRLADLLLLDAGGVGLKEWTRHLYLGASVVLAAAWCKRCSRVIVLLLVAGFGVLAALGSHTPLNAWLRGLIPPLQLLRYPEKHLLLTFGAVAILAGLGLERQLASPRVHWLRASAPALLLAACAAGLGAVGVIAMPGHVLAAALACAVASCLAIRRPESLAWAPALVIAADLGCFVQPRLSWLPQEVLVQPAAALAHIPLPGAVPQRLYHSSQSIGDLTTGGPNVAALWGYANVPGHVTGQSQRLVDLWKALSWRGLNAAELLDIDYLVLQATEVPPEVEATPDPDAIGIVEVPAVDRARLVARVEPTEDAHTIDRLRDPTFDIQRSAVVAPGPGVRALHSEPPEGGCRVESYRAHAVRFSCNTDRDALAILSDQHARGWQATLDGAPVPIVRVNYVQRGVYVGPGEHVVHMWYEPPGLRWGLFCTLFGLLSAALLWRLPRHAAGSFRREPLPRAAP